MAVRLSPGDERAWSYLGYAYAKKGEVVEAAAAFRRAKQDALAAELEHAATVRRPATPSFHFGHVAQLQQRGADTGVREAGRPAHRRRHGRGRARGATAKGAGAASGRRADHRGGAADQDGGEGDDFSSGRRFARRGRDVGHPRTDRAGAPAAAAVCCASRHRPDGSGREGRRAGRSDGEARRGHARFVAGLRAVPSRPIARADLAGGPAASHGGGRDSRPSRRRAGRSGRAAMAARFSTGTGAPGDRAPRRDRGLLPAHRGRATSGSRGIAGVGCRWRSPKTCSTCARTGCWPSTARSRGRRAPFPAWTSSCCSSAVEGSWRWKWKRRRSPSR